MKTKKLSDFIRWVNETFRPEHPQYPVAFERTGTFLVSGECSAHYPDDKETVLPVIDYYGEYRGGYPWIHPLIEEKAKALGLSIEWESPAAISFYDNGGTK